MSMISNRFFACCLACIISAAAQAEQLTFTTGDWRPYIFEEDGTVEPEAPGFSIEIVNAVFNRMGHSILYKTSPFLRQIRDVEQGRHTALVGVYREEAPNLVYPQEPIGMTQNCFYTKSESTWRYENLATLSTIKLAVVSGYTYGEIDSYIHANTDAIIGLYGGEADMMKRLTGLLNLGRVDAYVQDVLVAEHYFKKNELGGVYKRAGCLQLIQTMIGFSPNDHRTINFVREFDIQIGKLRSSGELAQILRKYGIADWK